MPFDLEQAVQQYSERIQRAALVLSGNPWDAEDLAQETFLQAARDGHRFRGSSSVYTWLYGILLNIERHRRRRSGTWRRKFRVLCDEYDQRPQTSLGSGARVEVEEWKKSLWATVAQLPDGQRQVLVLRFSEGLKYEEIAQVLDCPLGTVKSRIYHGLAALRQRLNDGAADMAELPPAVSKGVSRAI